MHAKTKFSDYEPYDQSNYAGSGPNAHGARQSAGLCVYEITGLMARG